MSHVPRMYHAGTSHVPGFHLPIPSQAHGFYLPCNWLCGSLVGALWWLWGSLEVALRWPWGGFGVPISWLSTGFGVALSWLWGGLSRLLLQQQLHLLRYWEPVFPRTHPVKAHIALNPCAVSPFSPNRIVFYPQDFPQRVHVFKLEIRNHQLPAAARPLLWAITFFTCTPCSMTGILTPCSESRQAFPRLCLKTHLGGKLSA